MSGLRRGARRPVVVSVVALCLLLLLGVSWLRSESRTAARAHDHALALWESTEPTAYSFDYSYCGGMCSACVVAVTVEDGRVTAVEGRDPRGCTSSGFEEPPTIEDIFALEQRERSAATRGRADIDYDPAWGFPASITLECPEGTSDCGTSVRVSHFRAGP